MAMLAAAELDFTQILHAGDTVVWGQASSEPLGLTQRLLAQRHQLVDIHCFIGVSSSTTLAIEDPGGLRFTSYCGIGRNARLFERGLLDIVPTHFSQLPELFHHRHLPVDVVLLHLSPPGPDGRHSLGVVNDYLVAAARQARLVVAQINPSMPWTMGSSLPDDIAIDWAIPYEQPLIEIPRAAVGQLEMQIAQHAVSLIPDGATLEMGIGALPDAVLAALQHHRHLGIHSGMIGDAAMNLMLTGVVDNSRKPVDAGMTTAGVLMGSQRLYDFSHRNPTLQVKPASYTHAAHVLAKFNHFVAINSAIEVDLSGQVNAEVVGPRYLGAVGGQGDFMRAALQAQGGKSIIVLPSVARNGAISRIVPRLSEAVVTTARSDADYFVTEWGVAHLRGQPLRERARRLLAIAHPEHRERLAQTLAA